MPRVYDIMSPLAAGVVVRGFAVVCCSREAIHCAKGIVNYDRGVEVAIAGVNEMRPEPTD
jgi:hypothetical protein